jgi:hypothetical protein
MTKKTLEAVGRPRGRRPTLSARLETVQYLNKLNSSPRVRRTTAIQDIADALVAAGHTSLDKQAKALGIHRATAWTIIKTKHKLGRLNTKTTNRILKNPDTPPTVRAVIQQYLVERPIIGRCRNRQMVSESVSEDK